MRFISIPTTCFTLLLLLLPSSTTSSTPTSSTFPTLTITPNSTRHNITTHPKNITLTSTSSQKPTTSLSTILLKQYLRIHAIPFIPPQTLPPNKHTPTYIDLPKGTIWLGEVNQTKFRVLKVFQYYYTVDRRGRKQFLKDSVRWKEIEGDVFNEEGEVEGDEKGGGTNIGRVVDVGFVTLWIGIGMVIGWVIGF